MIESSSSNFELLRGKGLQVVSYYIKSFNSDFFMGMHQHTQFEFMYAYKGNFYIELLNDNEGENSSSKVNTIKVKQGSFVFIDSNIFHRLRINDSDVWIYNLELIPVTSSDEPDGELNKLLSINYYSLFSQTSLRHIFEQKNSIQIFPDTSNVDISFKNLIHTLSKPSQSIEDKCYAQSELMIFILSIAKSIKMYSESNLSYIKQAILFIKKNLRSKLTLQQIADHVELNKIYLCNIFKKYTGKTVLQTINSLRISKSLQLLRDSNVPITSIPAHVGFSSYQQMFYEFKKFLDLSPTECRNAFLTDEVNYVDKKKAHSHSIKINEEDFSFDDEVYFNLDYKKDVPASYTRIDKKFQN